MNLANCFLTSKATPPERRPVGASVSFIPGETKTVYKGNRWEGKSTEKVSVRSTKSSINIRDLTLSCKTVERPSTL